MKIKQMNSGNYIPYTVTGTTVVIGSNPEITVDMAVKQSDSWETVDISHDAQGNLIEGVGVKYVANVQIPPKRYQLVDSTETRPDLTTYVTKKKQAIPLNPAECILRLWSI